MGSVCQGNQSPDKQEDSAIEVPETPDKHADSAIDMTESPDKRADSAIGMTESPDKREDSAIGVPESPDKQDDSAIEVPESPDKRDDSGIEGSERGALLDASRQRWAWLMSPRKGVPGRFSADETRASPPPDLRRGCRVAHARVAGDGSCACFDGMAADPGGAAA
jgi:hypothetical protein